MMDLNQHIVKNDDDKPFHSNGYAQVANGNQIGSTTSVSFEQRQLIERNRQLINNYNRSAIGSTYGVMRAKPVAPSATTNRTSMRQRSTVPQNNIKGTAPRHFSEPSGRTFNPYA